MIAFPSRSLAGRRTVEPAPTSSTLEQGRNRAEAFSASNHFAVHDPWVALEGFLSPHAVSLVDFHAATNVFAERQVDHLRPTSFHVKQHLDGEGDSRGFMAGEAVIALREVG